MWRKSGLRSHECQGKFVNPILPVSFGAVLLNILKLTLSKDIFTISRKILDGVSKAAEVEGQLTVYRFSYFQKNTRNDSLKISVQVT